MASVKEISNFTVENAIPQPKNEKDVNIQTQGSKSNLLRPSKGKEDLKLLKSDSKQVKTITKASLSLTALLSIQEHLSTSDSPSLSTAQATRKYEAYQNADEI